MVIAAIILFVMGMLADKRGDATMLLVMSLLFAVLAN